MNKEKQLVTKTLLDHFKDLDSRGITNFNENETILKENYIIDFTEIAKYEVKKKIQASGSYGQNFRWDFTWKEGAFALPKATILHKITYKHPY